MMSPTRAMPLHDNGNQNPTDDLQSRRIPTVYTPWGTEHPLAHRTGHEPYPDTDEPSHNVRADRRFPGPRITIAGRPDSYLPGQDSVLVVNGKLDLIGSS